MADEHSSNLPPDEFADMRADLVQASFGLSMPAKWEDLPEAQRDAFIAALASRIEELMDQSFEQLLAILYRLDVDERKADEAFSGPTRSAIARRLAEIVIERQLRTIRTRRQRSGGGTSA
ncbi:MAG: hypothetical protein N2Z21_08165 [Candidatus Sumerlaeaceae bacterium]|nr:hypothetical protein [Candidatus Sumerlaeaceae bacterium]